jgi:hypothetical protein
VIKVVPPPHSVRVTYVETDLIRFDTVLECLDDAVLLP